MAGRIPKFFIDDLVARADVVDVVGRRVTLKKAGREYKACCPFHNEKTPSFQVNPQKNFYHCFGCGASGDALRFVMDFDHLNFVEAVEVLASEMGLTVPREDMTPIQMQQAQAQRSAKEIAYASLTQAAHWFAQNLKQHPQKQQAIAYLQGRGVSGEIARDFKIGFAPNDRDGLQKAYPTVTAEQWLSVGLVVTRDDQLVDKFRNRIQFPIRDIRGQVIGFGGRIMQPSEHAPKYLNSPETDYFHKGHTLYGLYEMLRALRALPQVLVVEGYMDVVALAQAGIRHVVATLGTATTPEHLALLFRHTQEVVFAFDGDKAGRQAAWKALSITLPVLGGNRAARFFFLPDGEDPDSLVRNIGAEAFNAQLLQALSPGECLAQGLVSQSGLSWHVADDARRLLSQSIELVKSCQDVGVQYGLVQALSKAAAMQEWQVEKVLGIRTGMAVHRRPERAEYKPTWKNGKRVVVDEVFDPAKSLSTRLLGLLSDFPVLAQAWPQQDEILLRQLPQVGLTELLAALTQVVPDQVSQPADWMQPDQALQEWNDGWRQLVCQALQFVRDQCLKNGDVAPMTDKAVNDVRQWSERLRAECFKRGS